MKWTVTYRSKTGAILNDVFEAENRQDLFSQLSAKGINAIRVNATTDKTPRVCPLAIGRTGLAVFLGAVALAVIGVCVFVFVPDDDKPSTPKEQDKGKIASVETAKRVASAKPEVASKPVEDDVKRTKTYIDENGVERYPGGARVPRKNPNKARFPDRRAVKWAFDSEEQISALIDMEPGDIVAGEVEFGDQFVIDFQNSLTNNIVIADSDDEYSRRLKEGVVAAKQDLKDAMDRGEDIAKIVTDTRKEMRSLFEYKSMIEEQISSISSSGEYSDEEVSDFVEAANKMLGDRGVAPIKMPRLILNKFKHRKN